MAWRERKSGRAAGLASEKEGAPPWVALALDITEEESQAPPPPGPLSLSSSSSPLPSLGFLQWIFEELVRRSCGKGGPSLLVPSGL